MTMIADILLVAAALGAALYCAVLARRLERFNRLDGGMGGAIAVLSAQVDDMTRALAAARSAATGSTESLERLTIRAEVAASRLELLLATLHELPDGRQGGAGARRVVRHHARSGTEEALS